MLFACGLSACVSAVFAAAAVPTRLRSQSYSGKSTQRTVRVSFCGLVPVVCGPEVPVPLVSAPAVSIRGALHAVSRQSKSKASRDCSVDRGARVRAMCVWESLGSLRMPLPCLAVDKNAAIQVSRVNRMIGGIAQLIYLVVPFFLQISQRPNSRVRSISRSKPETARTWLSRRSEASSLMCSSLPQSVHLRCM